MPVELRTPIASRLLRLSRNSASGYQSPIRCAFRDVKLGVQIVRYYRHLMASDLVKRLAYYIVNMRIKELSADVDF